jgi:hypothetical protein
MFPKVSLFFFVKNENFCQKEITTKHVIGMNHACERRQLFVKKLNIFHINVV